MKHLTLARMFNANPNEARVRPHKRSDANLKHLTLARMFNANPNEVRVRPHKRSDANLKHLTLARMFNANPNEVRVRPHKRSDANLKHLTLARMFNANPNEVRVRPHKRSDAEPEASHAGSEVQREPDHSEGSLTTVRSSRSDAGRGDFSAEAYIRNASGHGQIRDSVEILPMPPPKVAANLAGGPTAPPPQAVAILAGGSTAQAGNGVPTSDSVCP